VLQQAGLQVASTLVFVYPLVALVVDELFERALPLGPRTYLGAAITLGGLAVSLGRPAVRTAPARPVDEPPARQ
jgi:drug/metabolite transporter (DMT)-like permease